MAVAGFPAGYEAVVCATRESEFPRLATLAKAFPDNIIPAFGLHPWFLRERTTDWVKNLRAALAETPGAHVGEIGLDKPMFATIPATEQIEIFEIQLALAEEFSTQAEIHCVRAWGDMMKILRRHRATTNPRASTNPNSATNPVAATMRMHFHDFSGSAEIARELAKMGATFSFPPRKLEHPTAKIASVLSTIPREKIFHESDAPATTL